MGWTALAAVVFFVYFGTGFRSLGPSIDGCNYATAARSFVRGDGLVLGLLAPIDFADVSAGKYVEPANKNNPPAGYLWPLVLALFFALFGAADAVVAVAGGVWFVATVPLLFALVQRLFTRRASHAACALYVFNPVMLGYTCTGLTENLFVFLMVAALWATRLRGRWLPPVLLGMLCALGQVTKQTGALWMLPLVLMLLGSSKIRVARVLVAILAFVMAHEAGAKYVYPRLGVRTPVPLRERVEAPKLVVEAVAATPLSLPSGLHKPVPRWIKWLGDSPLRDVVLVHSAPFPEHSYTRGLEIADAAQVLADNLPAFKERLQINVRLAVQALFWAMGNHALVVLMWVGLIVFLSRMGHRSLALAMLAAMACVTVPHVLTFAWLRYFQPAILFAVVIVAGLLDRLAVKWLRGRWRDAAIAVACFLCSFPFGVTAGIAGLERISDPFCGEIRAGDRQYFYALGEFVQHEVRPEQTLVCDVPAFAAWYGDRTTIWLPNDLPTLQRLVDRANIDFMLLVFQFRRPGYDRFWREWLNRKVAMPAPENGLVYVNGLRTPRGAVFLFRTGLVYR